MAIYMGAVFYTCLLCLFAVSQILNKNQLLDEVSAISRIIKVKVGITETLIILDITKTKCSNCFTIH